jgi:hypothetical protein
MLSVEPEISIKASPVDVCFSNRWYTPKKIFTFFLSNTVSGLTDDLHLLEYCVKPHNFQILFPEYITLIERLLKNTEVKTLSEREINKNTQTILNVL